MSSTLAHRKSRGSRPGVFKRVLRFLTQPPRRQVDKSLATIRDGLGIVTNNELDDAPKPHHRTTDVHVAPTESMARPVFYAPDMDGQADPGEVVWIWVPTEGPHNPPKERAMVVVGRNRNTILGLIISCNPEHRTEEEWMEIGAGAWDERGRQSWVRLDRILEASELDTRRQGVVVPRGRFERVANRLRNDFDWA